MYGNESHFASPLTQKMMQVWGPWWYKKDTSTQKAKILTKFYWGIWIPIYHFAELTLTGSCKIVYPFHFKKVLYAHVYLQLNVTFCHPLLLKEFSKYAKLQSLISFQFTSTRNYWTTLQHTQSLQQVRLGESATARPVGWWHPFHAFTAKLSWMRGFLQ